VKDLLTQMHQLNEANTPHVGSLERDRFEELVRLSETQTWLVRSSPLQLLGFLFVMNELAPYGSPNFLWFKERYSQFLYVDRIAVAPSKRKQGWGRRLYDQVIREAQKTQ
jgi:predicted GNAT superfamily acetyltransferase